MLALSNQTCEVKILLMNVLFFFFFIRCINNVHRDSESNTQSHL